MQTIAELFEEEGILGASFFFFRTASKRNISTHLITTLAYQLSRAIPALRDRIADVILDDPLVLSKNLESQMKALIFDPMTAAIADDPSSSGWTYVVLVDGLDECAPDTSHRQIINLLSNSTSSQLSIIIASRPEHVIRGSFTAPSIRDRTETLALDNNYLPDEDIRSYLLDCFREIKASHPSRCSIPMYWPSQENVNKLVTNASGQFIYAATVARYIESSRNNPVNRLNTILSARLSPGQMDKPFALLDALYHDIFRTVADIRKVLEILRVLLYFSGYCDSISKVGRVLGYSSGDILSILCDMHSLVRVQESPEQPDDPRVDLYHASLGDFFSDPLRSMDLYLHPQKCQEFVFSCIVKQYGGMLTIYLL